MVSAELLSRNNSDVIIVGTYDKNILTLAEGVEPEECLFVDCDMNTPKFVSIGNHMRLEVDNRAGNSFNPNSHYKIKQYNKKFPYATCYLIASTIEIQTTNNDHLRMAYADSTYKNAVDYEPNMRHWSTLMEHPSIPQLFNGEISEETIKPIRQTFNGVQGFVSRRLGRNNYLTAMNDFFAKQGVASLPLAKIRKYEKGLVDVNTLKRYMNDIISYAEIYGGEFSVTYKDEVEWN